MWNAYWTCWALLAAVTILSFAGAELYGLFTNMARTFSAWCWRKLGVTTPLTLAGHGLAWHISIIIWIVIIVVLTIHIWFGW